MGRLLCSSWLFLWCFLISPKSGATNKNEIPTTQYSYTTIHHYATAVMCANPPILLNAANPSISTAELSWASTNNPTETAWDIEILPQGSNYTGNPTISDIHNNPYTVTGLSPGTRYCYRVRANCGSTTSAWSTSQFCFNTSINNPSNCGIGFPINDENCNSGGNNFPILVSDVSGDDLGTNIRLKEVRLIIDHTWEQDLWINLIAPNGATAELSTNNGGSLVNPAYGDFMTANCAAFTSFVRADACVPATAITTPNLTTYIGNFLPENDFSIFDGNDPNGLWSLSICDDAASHVGTLEYIELIFEPDHCPAPSNISLNSLNPSSIEVSWTAGTAGVTTLIEVVPYGETIGSGFIYTPSSSPYTISNLFAATEYALYIKEDCGNATHSVLNCPIVFSTNCDTPPVSLEENFDNQTICTANCNDACNLNSIWQNNTEEDDIDWLVNTNSTPILNTGPDDDVSGAGQYLYIESGATNCYNKNAILTSNCLDINAATGNCHLSFQYFMHGEYVETLSLEVKLSDSFDWIPLWSQTGDQGYAWRKQFIDLSLYDGQTAQFRFIGKTGNHPTSNIALDQIEFYGATDVGLPNNLYYLDADNDGYGTAAISIISCSLMPPANYVDNDWDCDDANSLIHPNAVEIVCNEIDENCNGLADDNALPTPIPNTTNTVCGGNSIDLSINSNATGAYYWYENASGGAAFATGNQVMSPNLTTQDTFYVADSILIRPGLRITEVKLSFSSSTVELQNIGDARDCTDWIVVVNADNNNINNHLSTFWTLGDISPDEILTRDKNAWGESFFWNKSLKGWVLLIDENGIIIDAVLWNWTAADVSNFNTTINGIPYTSNDLPWTGAGLDPSGCVGKNISLTGNVESNSANDYLCSNSSIGNANLDLNLGYPCTSARTPIIVAVNEQPNLEAEAVLEACGTGFGDVLLTVTQGQAPYTYAWSNGATTPNLFDVTYDVYYVTVTDSNGCSQSLPTGVELLGPTDAYAIEVMYFNDVSCHGADDGSIAIQVLGGVPPYQFNWSAGFERDLDSPIDSLTTLAGNTYNVTVTDDAGCVEVSPLIVINEPAPLYVNSNIEHIDCFGNTNGSIEIFLNGGTAPYEYAWSNGATNEVISDLEAGIYDLTVTDSADCSTISPTWIIEAPSAALSYSVLDIEPVSCAGMQNAYIALNVNGGTSPYSYNWSGIESNERDIYELSGGNYQVTITDARDCEIISEVFVIEEASESLTYDAHIDKVSCIGMEDGNIELQVSGGIPPYQYAWSNFSTTPNQLNVAYGNYYCTITDAVNCFLVTEVLFIDTNPYSLIANYDAINDPTCHNYNDGFINISVTGGTMPYAYIWSNGSTENNLSDLPAGSYQFTITDATSCMFISETVALAAPNPIQIIEQTTTAATSNHIGTAAVLVEGGMPPYTFLWDDPNQQTTQQAINLVADTYTVTVTDSAGCSMEESIIVPLSSAVSSAEDWVNALHIFPNPVQNWAQLDLQLKEASDLQLNIYNALGEKIQANTYLARTDYQAQLNFTAIDNGIYFIQLLAGDKQLTQKIVVNK